MIRVSEQGNVCIFARFDMSTFKAYFKQIKKELILKRTAIYNENHEIFKYTPPIKTSANRTKMYQASTTRNVRYWEQLPMSKFSNYQEDFFADILNEQSNCYVRMLRQWIVNNPQQHLQTQTLLPASQLIKREANPLGPQIPSNPLSNNPNDIMNKIKSLNDIMNPDMNIKSEVIEHADTIEIKTNPIVNPIISLNNNFNNKIKHDVFSQAILLVDNGGKLTEYVVWFCNNEHYYKELSKLMPEENPNDPPNGVGPNGLPNLGMNAGNGHLSTSPKDMNGAFPNGTLQKLINSVTGNTNSNDRSSPFKGSFRM